MRVIARLDLKGNNLIKPIQLEGLRVMGDPNEFAIKYYNDEADELVLYDQVATLYGRNQLENVIKKICNDVFIPITVSGGIRNLNDVEKVFNAGADKVAINTAAIINPDFIDLLVKKYGSQSIVVSVDSKKIEGNWECYTHGGREKSKRNVLEWVRECENRGAGEIFVTSIDRDGTKKGLDIELGKNISKIINIPFILSGGYNLKYNSSNLSFLKKADGIAIGTILHYSINTIREIKKYVKN